MLDLKLFSARVDRVNVTANKKQGILGGTLDCTPELPRTTLRNVRVLSPNASIFPVWKDGKFDLLRQSGFIQLPNVGDRVICAFIEGYSDFAIVIGSIFDVSRNPSGVINQNTEGDQFRRQDAVWMHESGAFIRFRNLKVDPNLNVVSGEVQPEITIHHSIGTELKLIQTSQGVVAQFNHVTGSSAVMDEQGSIDTLSKGHAILQAAKQILFKNTLKNASIDISEQGDITITDTSSNSIGLSPQGITITDTFGNKLEFNTTGIRTTCGSASIQLERATGNMTVIASDLTVTGSQITVNGLTTFTSGVVLTAGLVTSSVPLTITTTATTFSGNITTQGNTTIQGTLLVNGTSTVQGAITMQGAATIQGITTLQGTAIFQGVINMLGVPAAIPLIGAAARATIPVIVTTPGGPIAGSIPVL